MEIQLEILSSGHPLETLTIFHHRIQVIDQKALGIAYPLLDILFLETLPHLEVPDPHWYFPRSINQYLVLDWYYD